MPAAPPHPPCPSVPFFRSKDKTACDLNIIMGSQWTKPATKVEVAVDNRSTQEGGVHLAFLEFHHQNPVITLVIMFIIALVALYLYKRYCSKWCCTRAQVVSKHERIEMKEMVKAIEQPPLDGLIIAGVEYVPK